MGTVPSERWLTWRGEHQQLLARETAPSSIFMSGTERELRP
jgi:hypothetical protein